MNKINKKDVVYYGHYPCEKCKVLIVKQAIKNGGKEFDVPVGIIYPNSVWKKHKCNEN